MPPNCLWTTVFNGVDSKSQDLTRQVIVMEDRRGKRASQEQVPGPEYQAMMKAPVVAHDIRDPWKPRPGTQQASGRHTIQPAVQGYAGSVPRGVRCTFDARLARTHTACPYPSAPIRDPPPWQYAPSKSAPCAANSRRSFSQSSARRATRRCVPRHQAVEPRRSERHRYPCRVSVGTHG